MSSNSTSSNTSIANEESFYIGINLQEVLYGIALYLYFQTMYIFLARRRAPRRSDINYAIFSSVALLLTTLWVVLDVTLGQKVLLLNQDYPIGPVADREPEVHASGLFPGLGAATAIILQQMASGLLVYRCRVLWDSARAVVIPSILWLFTLVLGILVVWVSSALEQDYHNSLSPPIGIAYYSIVVFLNVGLTSMICYRLVRPAETIKAKLGDRYRPPYFTGIMLLVESALLYTLCSIALLVAYGVGSFVQTAFSRIYVLMMCVSPLMLILRLAESKSQWNHPTPPPPSVVRFADVTHSELRDESGAEEIHLKTLPKFKSGDDGKLQV